MPEEFDMEWNKAPVGLRWVESHGFNHLFGQLHCRTYVSMLYPTVRLTVTLVGIMVMFGSSVKPGFTAAAMTFLKFCEALFFGITRPLLDVSESGRDMTNTGTLCSLIFMGCAGIFLTLTCLSSSGKAVYWPCFMLCSTLSVVCVPFLMAYDAWEWEAISSPAAIARKEQRRREMEEESVDSEKVTALQQYSSISYYALEHNFTGAVGRWNRGKQGRPEKKRKLRGTKQRYI